MKCVMPCLALTVILMLAGCCTGPGACGPYGSLGAHGDMCDVGCGGCGPDWNSRYLASGPLDALHNARKRLVCGSGCGEIYTGEWTSSPPDCVDPCHFEGNHCAVPQRMPVRRALHAVAGVYGKRFCDGCGHAFDDCGCGDVMGGFTMEESCDCGDHYSHHPQTFMTAKGAQKKTIASQPKLVPTQPTRTATGPTIHR